jgi:hypothetical protein
LSFSWIERLNGDIWNTGVGLEEKRLSSFRNRALRVAAHTVAFGKLLQVFLLFDIIWTKNWKVDGK